MGMRYLNGICQVAKKHGLLPEGSEKASQQSTDQEANGRPAQVGQSCLTPHALSSSMLLTK